MSLIKQAAREVFTSVGVVVLMAILMSFSRVLQGCVVYLIISCPKWYARFKSS